MTVKCPFCGEEWHPGVLLTDNPDHSPVLAEGGQCDCGAWWYEGMENVDEMMNRDLRFLQKKMLDE